jgi:hypothetical protein
MKQLVAKFVVLAGIAGFVGVVNAQSVPLNRIAPTTDKAPPMTAVVLPVVHQEKASVFLITTAPQTTQSAKAAVNSQYVGLVHVTRFK